MSGIYIPGMKMPKSCLACDWCAHTIPADNYICYRLDRAVIGVAEEDVNETVNVCCPLVPVPEHVDLIDREELWVKINRICDRRDAGIITDLTCLQQILSAVRHAPTIIPADPAKEGE